jgi:site-specific DNA-methyltransferase (adenine-specific)
VKPYYEQDGIVIYHGDCREVMPTLAPASFDLVVTSPPYNLGVSTGGGMPRRTTGKAKWAGMLLADGYGDYDDARPPAEYEDWQRGVLRSLWSLINDKGAIFYNHKPRVQAGVLWTPLAVNPGLPVRQIIVWARAGGVNFSPAFYVPTHEWIVVFAKPDWRLKSKGASGAGDVWTIAQEANTPHPAPFPEQLPRTAIETTGARRVLDPFVGWGTTLVAAKRLGVQAVGIELSERNCELAVRRLAQGALPLEMGA